MTNKEIFNLVSDVGTAILLNGGEIPRTKVTMERIACTYGIKEFSTYIITNGIFITGVMGDGQSFSTKIRDVPLSSTCLYRVEAINHLSRDIESKKIPPEEARIRLEEIKTYSPYSVTAMSLAAGFGSAAFCYLFKGTWFDCAMVFIIGVLLNLFNELMGKTQLIPRIMRNVFASAFVTLLCLSFRALGLGSSLGSMIIGCIMSLLPGVPLTNAVRHFFDNDYIAGIIRLTDALLVALSVSVGVGVIILIWSALGGGVA